MVILNILCALYWAVWRAWEVVVSLILFAFSKARVLFVCRWVLKYFAFRLQSIPCMVYLSISYEITCSWIFSFIRKTSSLVYDKIIWFLTFFPNLYICSAMRSVNYSWDFYKDMSLNLVFCSNMYSLIG